MNKSNKKLLGAGILTAIVSSLCCITPVLGLFAGISGIASAFSWLEPARPYFISITVLILGFAWYQKLRKTKSDEILCECEEDEKPSFFQSKKFLAIVTVFAIIMTAFPYYVNIFYPEHQKNITIVKEQNLKTIKLNIKGMTCEACETHVSHAALNVNGVIKAKADFKTGNAEITFDKSKTNINKIIESINTTGYSVEK